MADQLDTGDKLACGITFKKGLPSYSSIAYSIIITVSKREGETDEELSLRGWAMAEAELTKQVEASPELLEVIRPVQGDAEEWS